MRLLKATMGLVPILRNMYDAHLSGKFFTRDYRAMAQYSIGEYTYGMPRILFPEPGCNLIIGRFCSIAPEVEILLGGEHSLDWITTYPFYDIFPEAPPMAGRPRSKGDVKIGSDVWIGRGALILSGVEIGHGAVIGARSVCTRSIPPYAVCAGNPARVVRFRQSPEQIEALLEIQWWNWEISRIREALPLLVSSNLETFIKKYHVPGLTKSDHSGQRTRTKSCAS
jgi:acetyltransferase-like isoleucine patch superfamily enzyme